MRIEGLDEAGRTFVLIATAGLHYRLYWDRNFGTDNFRLKDARTGTVTGWSEHKVPGPGQVPRGAPEGLAWSPLEPDEVRAATAFVEAQPSG